MATKRTGGIKSDQKATSVAAPKTVRISQILIFILGFFVAILVALLFQSMLKNASLTLSTVDLLNLVFSSALSVSSIFLAITAIILSKRSEEIIINRATESRDLQSTLFTRTIEVLARIESSSGINEKRIDDLSRQLADLPKHAGQNREEEIRKIVRTNLLPESSVTSPRASTQFFEQESKKEEEFKSKVVLGVANIDKVSIERMGEGDVNGEGDDLVDSIYSIDGKRFTVSTFYIKGDNEIDYLDNETLQSYLLSLAKRISDGAYVKAFLVFNKLQAADSDFEKIYKEFIQVTDAKVNSKINIIAGPPEEIVAAIKTDVETGLK
jgi:hypothetical protein